MSTARCQVFLVAMTGVLIIMLSLEAAAQSTVDEESCQAAGFEEAVDNIRTDIKSMNSALGRTAELMKEDLAELKNLLGSRHQPGDDRAFDSSRLSNCIPLLVQQNMNRSEIFNRSWAEYNVGFNDTRGNYWLGNDLLHQLTTSGRYKLRFDLQAVNGSWYYAEYSRFIVNSEVLNYRIQVSGYSGNAGDGFGYHNHMAFTTYDRDNDVSSSNCAVSGGFWYKNCAKAAVNTGRSGSSFHWHGGRTIYLQTSRMWLTC